MGLLAKVAKFAAPIVGSGISSAMSMRAARKQMAFQERMSSTAHQRQMADLEAAGINPLLTAKLGGASTPAGAMPQISDLGQAASSAISLNLQSQNVEMAWHKLDSDLDEAVSRIATMNQEMLGKQADNYIKEKMVKFYQANPNIGTWHMLGGTPDQILRSLENLSFKRFGKLFKSLKNYFKK